MNVTVLLYVASIIAVQATIKEKQAEKEAKKSKK